MIFGIVTPEREAIIRVTVRDSSGQGQSRDAVVDTGFNGWLCLPPDLIGMGLLYGYELNVQAIDGGAVTITRITP